MSTSMCEVVSIAPVRSPFSDAVSEVLLEAVTVRLRASVPLGVSELEALCEVAGVSVADVVGCAEERTATA